MKALVVTDAKGDDEDDNDVDTRNYGKTTTIQDNKAVSNDDENYDRS